MAPKPFILARTFGEAHAFARETLGLVHGEYRVVSSAGTLKSVRGVDLYLAPGWDRRYDRFQMKGALRWTYMNVIRWEDLVAEVPEPPDGLTPLGVQLEIVAGCGAKVPSSREVEQVSPVEDAPAEPRRRRRRCKQCDALVDPDDVDQHGADHLTRI